jgi:pimeloyl-ACP methyl ester carboxylesterase
MGGCLLPAQDSLAELRAVISEHLKNFLAPNSNEEETPRPLAPFENALSELREWRHNPRRIGVSTTAPAVSLRDEVASEIAARLHSNPSQQASFDTTGEEDNATTTRAEVTTSNEGMEQAGSGSTVSSLPLGARLKPRGIFEDDWTATLSTQRPWPVILLHGTCDSKGIWQLLGADLREDGWAVFAPDYGTRATGLIPDSAAQVGAYIRAVMHTTGAKKVIIMGHSQGGLVARYWMRLLGGAKYVKHLVCIGTPNHGTTQGGILSPLVTSRRADSVMQSVIDAYFGPAGAQQIVGSDILDQVNRDGDLEEGVTYTNIVTRSDAVVVPPESCFLAPDKVKDGTVRNIYVQDFDRRAVVLHHDLPVDKRVRVIARTILRQIGPMLGSN